MTKLNDILKECREKERIHDLEWNKGIREREIAHQKVKELSDNLLRGKIIRASSSDYKKWLKGYLEKGGKPTHVYNYPLPHDWFIATDNFTILPLYGAQSINIIVPEGIFADIGVKGLGHNNLYFIKDFSTSGSWIPIYDDIEF